MKPFRGRPSKHITPVTVLMAEHFRQTGLDRGWGRNQVLQLCTMLKVTPYELGALVGLKIGTVSRYLRQDCFPTEVALHFQIMQDWYVRRTTGTVSPPRVPMDLVVF